MDARTRAWEEPLARQRRGGWREQKVRAASLSLIATITLKGANLSSPLGATSQSHTSNHPDCNKFPKAPLIPWNMRPDVTGVSGLLSWRWAGSARRTFHVWRFSFLFLFFPAETRLGTIWNFNNQTRKIKAEKCLGYCEADVFRIVRPIQSCCRHGNNTVETSATSPPPHQPSPRFLNCTSTKTSSRTLQILSPREELAWLGHCQWKCLLHKPFIPT